MIKTEYEEALVTLGKNIKKIRSSKNISQVELAHLCEMEKSGLSRIESGQSNITFVTLHCIAVALSVPVQELFS